MLAKYVDAELQQAERRTTRRGNEPAYGEEEIKRAVETAAKCISLLAENLVRKNGIHEDSLKIVVDQFGTTR